MFTGPGPEYKINGAWMDRVQEVVDYVMGLGMFCILNVHHDDYQSGPGWQNGWLRLYHMAESRPLSKEEKAETHQRFARLWEQIAERFKDYGERLILEGINEPRTMGMENITRDQWLEQNTFLMELLQTFVNTVRASGGANAERHLMVTPYFASVGMDPNDRDARISTFVNRETGALRIDDPRGRLIVSLHYYEPWGFVTAPSDSPWHSHYFDLSKDSVSSNMEQVNQILLQNFITHGIPVVMGETGAISRTLPDGSSNEGERVKWAEYYVSRLREMGIPTVIWDDGGGFKLLDRHNLRWVYPDLARALAEAGK
jgi:endoglucanase